MSHGHSNFTLGFAIAPKSFGKFAGDLLVGNFGNGNINAYNPNTGAFLGSLHDASNHTLSIDGLWALSFGNGGNAGSKDTLFFTDGPAGESHGLFGSLSLMAEVDNGRVVECGNGRKRARSAGASPIRTPHRPLGLLKELIRLHSHS